MKLYDEIMVTSSHTVTISDVRLPVKNKKIKVTVNGTNDPVDVFLFFDDKITGPIKSGDRIDTPVIPILNRIIEVPYEAKAIVVPRTTCAIPLSTINFDYSVKSSLNISTTAHLSIEFEGSYIVKDTKCLAKEYVKNAFSPSDTITQYIKTFIENKESGIIGKLDEITDETLIANRLPMISNALSASCKKDFISSWAKIETLRIKVTITNMEQVLEELNKFAQTEIVKNEKLFDHELELEKLCKNSTLENQRIMVKAIADVYGQSSIDPALSQVIITYLQCNPGLTYSEMTDAFRRFEQLSQRRSPAELLAIVNRLLIGGN